MQELIREISQLLDANVELVLVSIIASSGSTPRGKGAKMAVTESNTYGTVGGGAVEHESVRLAREALKEKRGFIKAFCLTKNQTADIGMICGGDVRVYFQYVSGDDERMRGLFKRALELFDERKESWLVTRIAESGTGDMALWVRGTGLLYADFDFDAEPYLLPNAVMVKGECSHYVEPLTAASVLYVFGGGHVSQELVPLAAHLGFSAVVYEDRADFADPALFKDSAKTVCGDFSDISRHITINPEDYVVIMTRGHQMDFEVLLQVMRTRAYYIGVIGSRHKVAATSARLMEAGIEESELARIHSPIGLPIMGETPAEIAVSIAAQLILMRAQRR